MERVVTLIKEMTERVKEDSVFVYAAQASFYVIIASVPFIMLLLSITQFVVPLSYNEVIRAVNAIMPERLHGFADGIINELLIKSTGSVISLTAITSLWPASRGVAAVSRGVRKVYQSTDKIGFFKTIFLSLLHTVAFMGMLLLSLVVMVFGQFILDFFAGKFVIFNDLIRLVGHVRTVIAFLIFCVFFAFVYRSFSGIKIRLIHQLPGAAFTTLGWIIFSSFFSVYIERFSNYSYIYGSLAAIVLIMLWLYSCMIIFLFGAEINVMFLDRYAKRKG